MHMADDSSPIYKLIEEIQKHPWLFDVSRLDYRNLRKKERSWNAISRIVGLSVEECMQKWRNLRDRYSRELRAIRKKKERTGEKISSPWPLIHRMEFLMNHVKHRSVSSKFSCCDFGNQMQNEDSEHCAESDIPISEGLDSDTKDVTSNNTAEDRISLPKSQISVDISRGNNSDSNWMSNPQPFEQNVDFPSPCSSTAGCSGTMKRSIELPDEGPEGSVTSCCHQPESSLAVKYEEEYNFGMIVASKLRKLPERIRDEVEIEILQLLLKVAK